MTATSLFLLLGLALLAAYRLGQRSIVGRQRCATDLRLQARLDEAGNLRLTVLATARAAGGLVLRGQAEAAVSREEVQRLVVGHVGHPPT